MTPDQRRQAKLKRRAARAAKDPKHGNQSVPTNSWDLPYTREQMSNMKAKALQDPSTRYFVTFDTPGQAKMAASMFAGVENIVVGVA